MSDNPSILSHVSIGTNDLPRAAAFYDRVREPLGCQRIMAHEQAVAWGLANRLVPHDNLLPEAEAAARQLSTRHPGSQKRIKSLLKPPDLAAALEREQEDFVAQIDTPETRASMLAFLEAM